MPFCQVSRLTTPNSSAVGSASRPKRSCSAALFAARAVEPVGVEARRRAAGRSPGSRPSSSMPLRMPDSTIGARAQQAVEPHAAFRRADLRGVGRADGGDAVGELQPGLQEADRRRNIRRRRSRRPARGRPSAPSRPAGNWPWKARLWTVITVAGRGAAGVVQIGRRQARLPVVRMHDVGPIAGDERRGRSRPRRAPAPRSGSALSGQSRAVRADDRDCPAGRRDAARRARAGRAPPPAPPASRAGPPNRSASCSDRDAALRALPAPPDSPAPACAPRRPAPASAPGSAPATSARPPVLTSGKISEATDEDVASALISRQPVDHRLGDQADALLGAAEALARRARDPRRRPGLRGSARRGRPRPCVSRAPRPTST